MTPVVVVRVAWYGDDAVVRPVGKTQVAFTRENSQGRIMLKEIKEALPCNSEDATE